MSDKNNLEIGSKMIEFVNANNLKNVKMKVDQAKGTAIITGEKDMFIYSTTIKKEPHGYIKTNTEFPSNMTKEEKIEQIKSLLNKGYTQNQIADILGISQALVSKYKNL